MKKVIISVTSDLVTDQRVHKVATTLHKLGYDVLLVGRQRKNSLELEKREYKTFRFKLWFEKGPLFYASYNLRLFFFLLFRKADALLANDLDTLLPNYLVSKLKSVELVYDNHEYYTGVPELINRPLVRKIWKSIERWIFPKIRHVYTVNESIAALYHEEYGNKVAVIRNVPYFKANENTERPVEFNIPGKILLYQGAGINIQRGVEELVESMAYVKGATLFIVGGGDAVDTIQKQVTVLQLEGKVKFIGKVPFSALRRYTQHADLGFSMDKDTNINYRFSLPNKLFDFIHAGVPVLVSKLPEIEKVVKAYKVGNFIESHDPKHIADCIQQMIDNDEQMQTFRNNALNAAPLLSWQEESKTLITIFKALD